MNRLFRESSAYLKHAASQKIDWYPWSEEAFEKARLENRPVFLSSGAVWCHWCHVMAEECFFDDEVAGILNENFVSVKLDRDERPDIDRRYQMAVAAMGSGGGWPLSVFLTPDRKPFFGGTYFPPEDRFGKPGFKKVLRAVIELYKTQRNEIAQYTEKIIQHLRSLHAAAGEINESLLNEAVTNILAEFDPQNGGFGTAPKFPMPGAMEFLIGRYSLRKNETTGLAVRKTLVAMAEGGFYDQVGGGFHRYSTDKAWIVPHFEKMADDNAWLLRNYISSYAVFGENFFREVAEGTVGFIRSVLSDPDGGFYASQDADVTPKDEGGYFTWTNEDFREALDEDEYRILSLHLLDDAGSMHHDESKKVLFATMSPDEIAAKTGKGVNEVLETIRRGKKNLLAQRDRRQAPFVDRTFYTSINGMLISVCLYYCRIFRDRDLKNFALHSLEKILKIRFTGDQLFHTEGVKALLDDYIHIIDALISAYEVTADVSFLSRAEAITGLCIQKLWDKEKGGFFDTDDHLLEVKIKGIEDIPHPSANSFAALILLKLHFITQNEEYLSYAEELLKAFSSRAKDLGLHSGFYFYALDAYFNALKLTLQTPPGSELAGVVLSDGKPYTFISYGEDRGCVIPCRGNICHEPIGSAEGIREFLTGKHQLI